MVQLIDLRSNMSHTYLPTNTKNYYYLILHIHNIYIFLNFLSDRGLPQYRKVKNQEMYFSTTVSKYPNTA